MILCHYYGCTQIENANSYFKKKHYKKANNKLNEILIISCDFDYLVHSLLFINFYSQIIIDFELIIKKNFYNKKL